MTLLPETSAFLSVDDVPEPLPRLSRKTSASSLETTVNQATKGVSKSARHHLHEQDSVPRSR